MSCRGKSVKGGGGVKLETAVSQIFVARGVGVEEGVRAARKVGEGRGVPDIIETYRFPFCGSYIVQFGDFGL